MIRFAMTLALSFLFAQVAFSAELPDLAHYKYGEGKAAEEADKVCLKTPLDQRGPLEDALIAVVSAKDATEDGKGLACRLLQRIGTEKCVPAVAGLLGDEVLSHYARLLLERLQNPKADEALRTALGNAPDKSKVGILNSLAERRDAQAVQQASTLATSGDPAVAAAAINALGRIGGNAAAECLSKLKPADNLTPVYMTALANCARTLKGDEAVSLCNIVLAGKSPQRVAALSAMLTADEKKALAAMCDFIKGGDAWMCGGVLTLVVNEPSERLAAVMSEQLGSLSDEKKAALITALGARGDKTALTSIAPCLTSTNPQVRGAALMAVVKLGDAEIIPTLLGTADGGTDAISRMADPSVDGALVKAMDDNKLRIPALKALVARSSPAGMPKLFELLNDNDATVRKAAWTAVGRLAAEEHIDPIAKAAFAIKDPAELACGVTAARDVCARASDKAKCFDVVAAYYEGTTNDSKAVIIELASLVGTPPALDLVKKALKSENKELRGKAVRSLAAWSNEQAVANLLELAKGAPDEVERILALRGYIRIAGLEDVRLNADQRSEMFKTAAEMATRSEEKKLIIGGMQQAKTLVTFAIVNKYMDDPALRNEAEQCAIAILDAVQKKAPPAEVKDLATKLAASKNGKISEKAKGVLANVK